MASRLRWKIKVGGEIVSTPSATDDVLYFGSQDQCVYAVDIANGEIVWRFSTQGFVYSPVIVSGDNLYFRSGLQDCAIYCLERRTAKVHWRMEVPGDEHGQLLLLENRLIYSDEKGVVYALDLNSQERIWSHETSGDEIHLPTMVHGDTLVFGVRRIDPEGSHGFGGIRSVNALDGKLKWKRDFYGGASGAPEIVESQIVVGATDGKMRAFSLDQGEPRWEFRAGTAMVRAVCTTEDMVYFGADRDCAAVGLSDGSLRWSHNPKERGIAGCRPLVVEDAVLFGHKRLLALDRETGEPLWSQRTSGSISTPPILAGGLVCVGCMDGFLYGITLGKP